MGHAYSYDLRTKVMDFIEGGKKTAKEASMLFNISKKTIFAWKKLKKETGDLKEKTGYQKGHRRIILDFEKFKSFIEKNNDKNSKELAKLWNQNVSSSTITRLLNKIGYSYKKNFLSPQNGYWEASRVSGNN